MAELPITRITPIRRIGDAWATTLVVSDGSGEVELKVEVSDTQRAMADILDPTADWIVERLKVCAPLLDNYRPVVEQVREWHQPLQLFADRP